MTFDLLMKVIHHSQNTWIFLMMSCSVVGFFMFYFGLVFCLVWLGSFLGKV